MTGQYVLVCPHRMLRPWSGQVEAPQHEQVPEFDASNPLCPGVVRANGQVSGATRIFPAGHICEGRVHDKNITL